MDIILYFNGSDLFLWDYEGRIKDHVHLQLQTLLIIRLDVYYGSNWGSKGNLILYLENLNFIKVN